MILCAVLIISGCTSQTPKQENCFTLKAEDFRKTIDGKTTDLYFLNNVLFPAAKKKKQKT
jgi:hypothetical protein